MKCLDKGNDSSLIKYEGWQYIVFVLPIEPRVRMYRLIFHLREEVPEQNFPLYYSIQTQLYWLYVWCFILWSILYLET